MTPIPNSRSHKLPSLIVIEEPEVGLHPDWLKVLAEWIKLASERTQVIITTHSPMEPSISTMRGEDEPKKN
jgi:predicted ATPase